MQTKPLQVLRSLIFFVLARNTLRIGDDFESLHLDPFLIVGSTPWFFFLALDMLCSCRRKGGISFLSWQHYAVVRGRVICLDVLHFRRRKDDISVCLYVLYSHRKEIIRLPS